jgi:acyl-CoA synthetase (AMP-forming)/AMP-acid ligase II
MEEELLAVIPPLQGIRVWSYQEVLREPGTPLEVAGDFSLVQFTSGSTAEPKGVVLNGADVVANVDAILERLAPGPNDNSCSWLPLSHDMGLIGMLLGSCIAGVAGGARGGCLYLMTPEHFLRKPPDWLRACSQFAATITAAPDFGFSLATRRAIPAYLDLAPLRVCIAGGEPVRASTLRSFANQFSASGFSSRAFCPSYGLAEAALAVTMTPVASDWESVRVDTLSLAGGNVEPSSNGMELVSSGTELVGYEVSAETDSVGILKFRGPSQCHAYVGGHTLPVDNDGWFVTNDLAFRNGGSLYVVGRSDDVLSVAGRNVYALDVEAALNAVVGIRSGRAVALVDPSSRLLVIAELDGTSESDSIAVGQVLLKIRSAVSARIGLSPSEVIFVERGQLPMTASGKIRRGILADALRLDQLPIISRFR